MITYKYLGTPVVPLFPEYFGVSLFKLNMRKKCTLLISGVIGEPRYIYSPTLLQESVWLPLQKPQANHTGQSFPTVQQHLKLSEP